MASAPPPPLGEDPPFAPTLAAARAGATWALKQLYHHHAPQVAGYLGRRGVPDVEASTKAVFLRMARNLANFEGGEDDFRAMLFSFTRGQAVDDLGEAPTQPIADPHPGERRRQDATATPIRLRPSLSSAWSSPAAARLRSLASAHTGWIFAVVAFALVAVVVAAGAPSILPSASRPRLGAVEVSPPDQQPAPSPPAQARPEPADEAIPPCPRPTSGSTSTTSSSTPVSSGWSTCAPATSPGTADATVPKTSTAVEPKATTTMTTAQRPTTISALRLPPAPPHRRHAAARPTDPGPRQR